MTIQISDILVYEGERYYVWSFPLESYYESNPRPNFEVFLSGMDRGYEAIWQIEGDILYLTEIKQAMLNGAAVGLAELFPGQGARVEASWFTGQLRIPGARGHTDSDRRRDRLLTFRNGKLVRCELDRS
jgi:hypothetical protein